MPWILETAAGKFIDSFEGRAEAETARKKCGIMGAKLRGGKVPLAHALTKAATKVPTFGAVRLGAVSADDFRNIDSFVLYLAGKNRSQYTQDEFTTLAYHMHVVDVADLTKKLKKLGLTPAFETLKMSRGVLLTNKPAAPPKTVEHVKGKPVALSGSFKPLPVSPAEKAKILHRMLPDIDLSDLDEKIPESMGALSKAQLKKQQLAVKGLKTLDKKIAVAVDLYNDRLEAFNGVIQGLAEAVAAYNYGVEHVNSMLDQWIASGEEYAEKLSAREPPEDEEALRKQWEEETVALDAWLDQIRETREQIDDLDETSFELPEALAPFEEIPPDQNADRVAAIPEGPSVRPLSRSERKKLKATAKKN